MNVFISWSGERSRRVGVLLDEWLQCVIQKIKPWMSSKDIDRGAIWFSEITDQLKDTSTGIICLTKENINKPWILFEAGALLKGLSSNRVCTLLIDLEPTDISDPLSQFNHTLATKEGIWSLVRTLNNSLLEDRLSEKILERIFDTYWIQFELDFKKIIEETIEGEKPKKKNENEILYEILNSVKVFDRRIRNLEQNTKNIQYDFILNNSLDNQINEIIKNNRNQLLKTKNPEEYILNELIDSNMFTKENLKNKIDYESICNYIKNSYYSKML